MTDNTSNNDVVIDEHSPCTVYVETLHDGGAHLTLSVPTYGGVVSFDLKAERDADGDWRVYVPWPDGVEDGVIDEMEVVNGVLCLGSPDVPRPATAD